MARAATSAGLDSPAASDGKEGASTVTPFSRFLQASYPAEPALSRQPRSHWSVLGVAPARDGRIAAASIRLGGQHAPGRGVYFDAGSLDTGLTGSQRPLYSAGF